MTFDGATYDPAQDQDRLTSQSGRVFDLMIDREWRTLAQIANVCTPASEASVSARLRDFRKVRFGGHTVNRRRLTNGLYEYQVVSA